MPNLRDYYLQGLDSLGVGHGFETSMVESERHPQSERYGGRVGDVMRNMVGGAELNRASVLPGVLQDAGSATYELMEMVRNPRDLLNKERWADSIRDIQNQREGRRLQEQNPGLNEEQLRAVLLQAAQQGGQNVESPLAAMLGQGVMGGGDFRLRGVLQDPEAQRMLARAPAPPAMETADVMGKKGNLAWWERYKEYMDQRARDQAEYRLRRGWKP